MNKIIFVGGSKGGTGKSIVCSTVLDYLSQKNLDPVLVETDTSNPDVYKSHKSMVNLSVTAMELDGPDGWIELINLADKSKGRPLVVNTAARNLIGVEKYGVTLINTLSELDRKLITLWTINRQRDSLELLTDYLQAMPVSESHVTHVVRNLYFGEQSKYQLYFDSEIKKKIESSGRTIDFPELADRVSDDLATRRLSIQSAVSELPIGNRAELLRWRIAAHRALSEVL